MLEIISVGAKVKYCFETTAGVRPTTGYVILPDINQAPEINLSTDSIDVSNIGDAITRYRAGRQDAGGTKSFTINATNNAIEGWNNLVAEAKTKLAAGKRCWFEYAYPGATKSYFWCGQPMKMGNSGISQNALVTAPADVILDEVFGWASASTAIAASVATVSITGTGTASVTVTGATGSITAASTDTGVATVVAGTGSAYTVTGVAEGQCEVSFTDATTHEVATVLVTVSAAG